MQIVQVKTVITLGVVGFLAAAFVFAMKVRITDPTAGFELAARELGGTYLGAEGVVRQDRVNNCGPAALKMVLDCRGKPVPLKELENTVRASEEGWSMRGLKEIAERYGISATGWMLTAEDLCKRQLPAILFVENRHFVVVDSVDTNGFFFLRDPALGRVKLHRRALGKIWKGKTLVFGEKDVPGG